VAVLLATRWIIAKLRNRQFFTLTDLNDAIRDCVTALNARVTRHLGTSRRALFDEIERPALKPLPAEPYTFAQWKECRAGLDYHVEVEKHYYSVPHQLLQERLWARITTRTVELFHHGKRVAAHLRSFSDRKHTTVREHMPSSHQRYADWTPGRLKRQAGEIGRNTATLVELILTEKTHPEQGFRACIGILRLAKGYGAERLEAACARALEIGARSYTSGQLDPEDQPRSPTARSRHGRAGDRPQQHPWPPLLPLRRTSTMLTHPTIDQLRTLKLDGMADAFIELQAQDKARDLAHAEWLALLLDREAASRSTRRFQTRLRAARLRHSQASIENVDYRVARRLDKALFQQIATCRWIAEHRNLLVTGPCGIGKSWLSCALAQRACRDGYTVHYARVPRLFADLELAHGDGRFARLFRTLTKADLLILDDWGPERFTASQRRDLMEIVEDRYGAGSTLITSQLPVEAWHEVIGEPTFADAILDRIVHNAYRFALEGPSMRKPEAADATAPANAADSANALSTKPTKGTRK
jgi:DNA replication protein DnaC/transposase